MNIYLALENYVKDNNIKSYNNKIYEIESSYDSLKWYANVDKPSLSDLELAYKKSILKEKYDSIDQECSLRIAKLFPKKDGSLRDPINLLQHYANLQSEVIDLIAFNEAKLDMGFGRPVIVSPQKQRLAELKSKRDESIRLREKSEEIKAQVDTIDNIDDLMEFDVTNDNLWQG